MKKNDPYFLLYNKLDKTGYGKLFCYFKDILQLNLRDKSVTIIVKKLKYDEDITVAYRQNALKFILSIFTIIDYMKCSSGFCKRAT